MRCAGDIAAAGGSMRKIFVLLSWISVPCIKKKYAKARTLMLICCVYKKRACSKDLAKKKFQTPRRYLCDEVKSSSKVPKPWHRITAIPYGVGRRSTIKSSIGNHTQ
mmetsp:Transcript_6512/g.16515  ORF Transcript_6512/g.16515 Transcript_6512/m.16515 type:complete len:107 (+) Transcript_6512:1739-2059(+)